MPADRKIKYEVVDVPITRNGNVVSGVIMLDECQECGALVFGLERHTEWHLTGR